MLIIKSNHFEKGEKKLVRIFSNYVLSKFVKQNILKKSRIIIKILDTSELDCTEHEDLIKYKAWCTYDGIDEKGIKCFSILINAKEINKRGKKPKTRLKLLLHDLAHELCHVKQYLNKEMRDYVDGSYMFLGKKYDPIPDGDVSDEYYDSPSEVDSYGREYGLNRMFWLKVKKGEILL